MVLTEIKKDIEADRLIREINKINYSNKIDQEMHDLTKQFLENAIFDCKVAIQVSEERDDSEFMAKYDIRTIKNRTEYLISMIKKYIKEQN